MPRVCTVCGHPERQAIDMAILANEPSHSEPLERGLSGAVQPPFRKSTELNELMTRSLVVGC